MRWPIIVVVVVTAALLVPVGLNGWHTLLTDHAARSRADALVAQGTEALEAGDVQRAVMALQNARDLFPSDLAIRRTLLGAQARLVADDPTALTGKTAMALEVALRVTPDAGTPVERSLALGEIALARNRLDDATKWFAAAEKHDDKRASPHFGLGKVAALRGKTEKAAEHFAAAVKRAPQDWRVRRAHGVALGKIGKWTLAVEAFAAAAELQKEPSLLHRLGEARVHVKDFEGAVSPLEKAVAGSREASARAEARSTLGFVYFQLGRNAEAIDQLQRSAREQPDPMTVFNLGVAYEATGDLKRAVDLFQRTLLDAPTNGEAHTRLVQALARLGRHQDAQAALARLKRLAKNQKALTTHVERAEAAVATPPTPPSP